MCIIDDNTSITNMFAKLAKIKGHDCVIANDGRTGLSLLENGTYDVAILDLAMPEFSGIDVKKWHDGQARNSCFCLVDCFSSAAN